MNAALALFGGYAYIGSRTDSSGHRTHAGVLIVDVTRPSRPHVVGEILGPAQARPGETSRELRVWRREELLMVMDVGCSALHACAGPPPEPSITFYDLRGARARRPKRVATYHPPIEPHEMFLWQDPTHPDRALLYLSTDMSTETAPGLIVVDISAARRGVFTELARWQGGRALHADGIDPSDVRLHSMSVSSDGTRTYVAHLAGGFVVLDSSSIASGAPRPTLHALTETPLRWSPGPHSAIEAADGSLVLTTDEVYGGGPACPWGWVRLIDATNPAKPRIVSELRSTWNQPSACRTAPDDERYSMSAHDPTVAGGVAFVSWHGAGLVAAPVSRAEGFGPEATFVPTPLPSVTTEDPRLTAGPVKVAVWSTPIVSGGLIYVVDLRNGLYVLRYRGVGEIAIAKTAFREGSSNLTT
jgi:hypothetical protein